LKLLDKHLGKYPRILCAPYSISENELLKPGAFFIRFPDKHFQSVEAYSRLLMSQEFYNELTAWSHVLIYQLDCLVFSDELLRWCELPYDYIGAPWFKDFKEENCSSGLWAAGNGGFSLRRVDAFLKLLRSSAPEGIYRNPYIAPHYGLLPKEIEKENQHTVSYQAVLPSWERWPFVQPNWCVEQELQRYMYNEDAFWAFEAKKFDPRFRVAPPEVALKFCFEMNPSWCFEKNAFQLPFGAHAWARYDKAFWEKILRTEISSI
jgi:hypothetical protein